MLINNSVRMLVVALGSLCAVGCTTVKPPNLSNPFNNDYSPIAEYLSAVVKREMKAGKITGLSIALVDNKKVIWSEGFGFADKKNKILADSKTKYRAASISKLFNAVAAMKSVEQGVLDLDAPIVDYVPNFKIGSRFGSTDNITLRNLLTHHSGLPVDHASGMWTSNPGSLESIVGLLKTDHVAFPANKIWAYSNIGVALSGLAIQEQNNKAYEEYQYDSILEPLQMVNSDFTGRLTGSHASLGYSKGREVEELPIRDLPAGGLSTTVEDLSNFMIAMLNNGNLNGEQIVDASSMQEMFRVQNANNLLDVTQRMGLGWIYQPTKLNGMFDIVGHNGSTMGHSSQFWMVPELGIGVVILANSFDFTQANYRIALAALEQLHATRGFKKSKNPDKVVVAKTIATGRELEGDYAGGFGLISIKRNNKKYSAKAMGLNLSLTKVDEGWFIPRVKLGFLSLPSRLLGDIKVTQSTIDGHDLLIAMEEGIPLIVGERIQPVANSAIWDKRLGYYKASNPSESNQLLVEDILLKKADGYYLIEVTYPLAGKFELPVQPINDSQLLKLGLGSATGDTITFSDSTGTPTLTMSGRKMALEKSE